MHRYSTIHSLFPHSIHSICAFLRGSALNVQFTIKNISTDSPRYPAALVSSYERPSTRVIHFSKMWRRGHSHCQRLHSGISGCSHRCPQIHIIAILVMLVSSAVITALPIVVRPRTVVLSVTYLCGRSQCIIWVERRIRPCRSKI